MLAIRSRRFQAGTTLQHLLVCLLLALNGGFGEAAEQTQSTVDPDTIDAELRVILERRCSECHAASLKKPKGRFGYIEDLPRIAANEDYVIPGEPDESEFYLLLIEEDPDARMPPEDSKRSGTMTAAEIELARDWIVLLGQGHEIRPPGHTPDSPPADDTESSMPQTPPDDPSPSDQTSTATGMTLAHRFGLMHLLLLHFPIVLLWAASGSEGLHLLRRQDHWRDTTRYLLWTGLISCLLAVFTGLRLADQSGYSESAESHERLAFATTLLTLLTLICHECCRRWDRPWLRWLERGLLLAASICVALTGHFGGALTHDELPF